MSSLFCLSPSLAPFLRYRPAGRGNGGGSLPFTFPPKSPTGPLPTTPAFLRYTGWFRTVLLSVDVARFVAFLLSRAQPRSPAGSMPADLCRCWSFVPTLYPPSQKHILEDRKSAGTGSRRETRRGPATRSPVWNGPENPAQASETDGAPAEPRYETEMRGRFRARGRGGGRAGLCRWTAFRRSQELCQASCPVPASFPHVILEGGSTPHRKGKDKHSLGNLTSLNPVRSGADQCWLSKGSNNVLRHLPLL